MTTHYKHCACCGQKLATIIQPALMPGRPPRIYVTCENKNGRCPLPPGRTLSPDEHQALCQQYQTVHLITQEQ